MAPGPWTCWNWLPWGDEPLLSLHWLWRAGALAGARELLVPQPGSESMPPAVKHRILTTGKPGKSLHVLSKEAIIQNFEIQSYIYYQISMPIFMFWFVSAGAQEFVYIYIWDFICIQNWYWKLRKTSWHGIFKAVLCYTMMMSLFITYEYFHF